MPKGKLDFAPLGDLFLFAKGPPILKAVFYGVVEAKSRIAIVISRTLCRRISKEKKEKKKKKKLNVVRLRFRVHKKSPLQTRWAPICHVNTS